MLRIFYYLNSIIESKGDSIIKNILIYYNTILCIRQKIYILFACLN